MRAIVLTQYGPPEMLRLTEIPKPVPGENDLLIRVHASSVTLGDCELRAMTLPLWTRIPIRMIIGFRKPRRFIPGMEISGVVEMVGRRVTSFKPGDAVFGSSGMQMGGNAEYICRSAKSSLAIKPENISHEQAVTISVGGINALHFLRKANIQRGQNVLIIGAGGSIGTYAVQLARYFGAEVTAVDTGAKLDMLKSIGADHVIDYTKEDYFNSGKKYDVVFDVIYTTSFSKCIDVLTREGTYLMANPGPRRMLRAMTNRKSKKKVIFEFAAETREDLLFLAGLIADGKIKPVIDKTFFLENTAEAHAYVEQGFKKGCLVILN